MAIDTLFNYLFFKIEYTIKTFVFTLLSL